METAMYWIEHKYSRAGFKHVGNIETACRSAHSLCESSRETYVVWQGPDRMAECSRHGQWLSKRARWEMQQIEEARCQAYGNFCGMMGEE